MPVLSQPGQPGTELVSVPIPTPARTNPQQAQPAAPVQQQPQDDESLFTQVPGAPLMLLPHVGAVGSGK